MKSDTSRRLFSYSFPIREWKCFSVVNIMAKRGKYEKKRNFTWDQIDETVSK